MKLKDWIKKVNELLLRYKLLDGDNYRVERGAIGTRLIIDIPDIEETEEEESSSALSIQAKLKATTADYQTYTADIYIGGADTTPIETDKDVKIRNISESEVIPFLNTKWAFYDVKKEYWPVTPEGGGDPILTLFWTCFPPIIPGELDS